MAEDLFSSPTPFTPPTTEEDRLAWLRLIRSRRVGVSTFFRLLSEFGTARAALDALPEIARAAGVDRYAPFCREAAEREVAHAHAAGASMLCFGTPAYPASLASIGDPPPVLWCIGDLSHLSRPMVAMVGARNASSLGTRMARRLAEGLGAAGFTLVSGLARGIDAAAHDAALASGTVAVQAGGVDVIYPLENTALAGEIGAQGLMLSEQPMRMAPQARHFPRRNRIISGLANAVVVVEAANRSGSLITARDALDQGREVMAVPGHPFDARAAGCNALIRDGATLVRGVEDVLAALEQSHRVPGPPSARSGSKPNQTPVVPTTAQADADRVTHDPGAALPRAGLAKSPRGCPAAPAPSGAGLRAASALHGAILARLGPSPLAEDQLIRDLALPAAKLAPELLTLEMEGRIARQPGGLLARID